MGDSQVLELEQSSGIEVSSPTTTPTPSGPGSGRSGGAPAAAAEEVEDEEDFPSEEEELIQEVIDLYAPEGLRPKFVGYARAWAGLWTPEQVSDALIDAVGKPEVKHLPRYVNGTLVHRKDEPPRPPTHAERERYVARAEEWQGASLRPFRLDIGSPRVADLARTGDVDLVEFMLGRDKIACRFVEAMKDPMSPWASNLRVSLKRWREGKLAQESAVEAQAYYSWLESDEPYLGELIEGDVEPDWPTIKAGLAFLAHEFDATPWIVGSGLRSYAATFPASWFIGAAKSAIAENLAHGFVDFFTHRLLWQWWDELHPDEEDAEFFLEMPQFVQERLDRFPQPPSMDAKGRAIASEIQSDEGEFPIQQVGHPRPPAKSEATAVDGRPQGAADVVDFSMLTDAEIIMRTIGDSPFRRRLLEGLAASGHELHAQAKQAAQLVRQSNALLIATSKASLSAG